MQRHQASTPIRQRGLSLIETLVGTAVVASTAATVGPGLAQWRTQLALQQTAAQFETDVHHARSLSLARNETLRLAFDDSARCWVVYSGPRDGCQCVDEGPAQCADDAQAFRVARLPAGRPVTVNANVKTINFDPLHGTASPAATVRFTANGAKSVHQVVGIMGRVRSCVPGGGLPGYKAC